MLAAAVVWSAVVSTAEAEDEDWGSGPKMARSWWSRGLWTSNRPGCEANAEDKKYGDTKNNREDLTSLRILSTVSVQQWQAAGMRASGVRMSGV